MNCNSEIDCKCGSCGTCKPTVGWVAAWSGLFTGGAAALSTETLVIAPTFKALIASRLGFFGATLTSTVGVGAVVGAAGCVVGATIASCFVEKEGVNPGHSRNEVRQPIAPAQQQMRTNYGAVNNAASELSDQPPATFGVKGMKLASSSHID